METPLSESEGVHLGGPHSHLLGKVREGNLQGDRASRHHIIVNKQTTIVGFDSVPPWKEALS